MPCSYVLAILRLLLAFAGCDRRFSYTQAEDGSWKAHQTSLPGTLLNGARMTFTRLRAIEELLSGWRVRSAATEGYLQQRKQVKQRRDPQVGPASVRNAKQAPESAARNFFEHPQPLPQGFVATVIMNGSRCR
eukprot:scaffold294671_cov15-Tisochrysis_lutea.AAC.1